MVYLYGNIEQFCCISHGLCFSDLRSLYDRWLLLLAVASFLLQRDFLLTAFTDTHFVMLFILFHEFNCYFPHSRQTVIKGYPPVWTTCCNCSTGSSSTGSVGKTHQLASPLLLYSVRNRHICRWRVYFSDLQFPLAFPFDSKERCWWQKIWNFIKRCLLEYTEHMWWKATSCYAGVAIPTFRLLRTLGI